jgi:flagellin-like protein
MKKLLKSKKALSPVVAAIILIAVTVAVSIAVAAWMGSLTIGFMNTKEAKITAMTFGTTGGDHINVTVTNPGTTKVNIATIKINDASQLIGDITVYDETLADVTPTNLPVELAAGATYILQITETWTAGNKYSVSFFETDGTLVGSYTGTA